MPSRSPITVAPSLGPMSLQASPRLQAISGLLRQAEGMPLNESMPHWTPANRLSAVATASTESTASLIRRRSTGTRAGETVRSSGPTAPIEISAITIPVPASFSK